MENKSNTKGVFLIVFAVISLLLGGFIIYDKLLKKETCNCPKTDCQCEKCKECEKCEENNNTNNCPTKECQCKEDKDVSYYTQLLNNVKYRNLSRPDNYITFDTKDMTWKATYNNCHGYNEIAGKYTIENNEIILTSETFEDGKNEFSIVSGNYSGDIILIYDVNRGVQGCSEQEYFVAENYNH